MKKILSVSFGILTIMGALFLFACNSNSGKPNINKTWNFSGVIMSDSVKSSPWASMAVNMMSSSLKGFKIQFNNDNIVKTFKDNTQMSSGKYTMPDANSVKFAMAGDSEVVYKIELTDTSLNLNTGAMGMHFTPGK